MNATKTTNYLITGAASMVDDRTLRASQLIAELLTKVNSYRAIPIVDLNYGHASDLGRCIELLEELTGHRG